MNPSDDRDILRLRDRLIRVGSASASELAAFSGVSVATVRRRLAALGPAIVRYGRARAARYAIREPVDGVGDPIPLFELGRAGERPEHVADLVPLADPRVLVLGRVERVPTAAFDDLPWFLDELRPAGFLGRRVPARHPELGLPPDVLRWTTRDVLAWAARHAWDGVGAFVLGADALAAYGAACRAGVAPIALDARGPTWEALADEAVREGPVGSSAGGEQPKLLAVREGGAGGVPVLVKWSPPVASAAGERVADLLRAEAHALAVLSEGGVPAARAQIVTGARRVLLEVERFDRDGPFGRIGQVSLAALDAQFVGSAGGWSRSARGLRAAGLLSDDEVRTVSLLDRFAALIGHGDRHLRNLSVRLVGARPAGLCPAYDFAPMRWGLVGGEVPDRAPEVVPPTVADAPIEALALALAAEHWRRVATDADISPGFRAVARQGCRATAEVEALGRWLPR